MQEMRELRIQYRDQDNHFLFESGAERVQMVVDNQGEEPIIDASLSLIMPSHNAFYVAETLPKVPRDHSFSDRTPELAHPLLNFRRRVRFELLHQSRCGIVTQQHFSVFNAQKPLGRRMVEVGQQMIEVTANIQ